MPSSVVLDTSVLFPMTHRDTLLRCAEAKLYAPYWSPDILDELSKTLIGRAGLSHQRASRLIAHMTRSFPDALVTGYQHHIPHMANHPKDRHVLAAALHAGAQIIVTSNLRDFSAAALRPHRITAKSPDDFLCGLVETNPSTMKIIIQRQAADHSNPPQSVGDVVNTLERSVPAFASEIRDQLVLDQL